MSLSSLLSIPITIKRAGSSTDRYGNANIDWAHPTLTTVSGWLDINQRRMEEDDKNRSGGEMDGSAYLPAGTDVESTDRLLIDGSTYEIFGIPAPIYRPGWGVHHIECRIKRFEG